MDLVIKENIKMEKNMAMGPIIGLIALSTKGNGKIIV
jgi:hypothetical protein